MIDASADKIPYGRVALPFIDEKRALRPVDPTGVSGEQFPGAGIVECENRVRAPTGGCGLAYALGSLQGNGRQTGEKLIKLSIDGAREIRPR